MELIDVIKYYLNDEILEKIAGHVEREVVAKYGENFGKRPNVFYTKEDVKYAVKNGATSFHFSEERWSDPLKLNTNLTKEQLNQLRIGWDLVIDIDADNWQVGREFAKLIVEELEKSKVHSFNLKFSGGSGFHILIPFEAFPKTLHEKDIKELFPEVPMVVSNYLKMELKDRLLEILKKDFNYKEEDPFQVADIDSVLISERHLVRMQYSLNEKKWLVSVPIDRNKLSTFTPEDATPGAIDTKIDFFDVHPKEEDIRGMAMILNKAYEVADYRLERFLSEVGLISIKPDLEGLGISTAEELLGKTENELYISLSEQVSMEKIKELLEKIKKEVKVEKRKVYTGQISIRKINPEFFPPCIKNILNGLEDGKKRSVFILMNFFRMLGMSEEEVERVLREWNEKNKPPLKDSYLNSQIKQMRKGKIYVVPNCDSPGYYKYFGVCTPDETCKLIKNPISYYLRKAKEARSDSGKEEEIHK